MSPIARQELHDFAARVRERKAREQEPKEPMSFTDKYDAAVVAACLIGGLILAMWGA